MRKCLVALTFLLVVLGCGGSSDTATSTTTAAPSSTLDPTTTAAPATTAPTTTTAAPATTAPTTTTAAPATTTEPTTTTTVSGSQDEGNLFATANDGLRSCFLQTLGPEVLGELVNGREPTPEEGQRFGPCLGAQGSTTPGGGDTASQTPDQASNLFASASPELRDCIIGAVGQTVFEKLARGERPSQEEGAKFGHCMGAQGPTTPGGSGESSDSGSCMPEDPSGYGRPSRDFLLGIKAFQLMPGNQSVSNATDIKALGMNAVSLSFQIPFDEGGRVRYPFSSFGTSHPTLDASLCHIGNLVHEMKTAGLSVYLSGEPIYYAIKPGVEPFALDDGLVATYTQELLGVMEALASTAETYKVDWLAPISEPDKYFGPDPADEFMQEIRPLFGQFQGKLVWQVAHDDETRDLRFDLSGYDVAGIAALGCDTDGEGGMFDQAIENIVKWAQEDQVPEVAHAEFGCIGKAQDIPAALTNLQRWYDATSGFGTGLFILDEPRSAPNAQQVVGTWLEDWVLGIAEERGLR